MLTRSERTLENIPVGSLGLFPLEAVKSWDRKWMIIS